MHQTVSSHVISGSAVVILISYGHRSGRTKVTDVTFILVMNIRKTKKKTILMSRLSVEFPFITGGGVRKIQLKGLIVLFGINFILMMTIS